MPILKLTGNTGEYLFDPEKTETVLSPKGKFGAVFAGIRTHDGRKVVIKHFNNDLLVYPYSLVQFKFEADAKLESPFLRKTFEYINTGNNHFLIQEYITGYDLKTFLSISRKHRNSVDFIVRCMISVLQGLEYLHGKNIVHCDLKPANILIETDEKSKLKDEKNPAVRIIDLGNARTPLNLFIDTLTPFSLVYSPPEQALHLYNLVDAQSDVYTAGIVLYELITGTPPFASRHPEALMHQQVSGPLVSHPAIPAPLFEIIKKATAKISLPRPPAQMEMQERIKYVQEGKLLRYASAKEMRQALEEFLQNFKPKKSWLPW
jgi:serine/threonine-protein kinase